MVNTNPMILLCLDQIIIFYFKARKDIIKEVVSDIQKQTNETTVSRLQSLFTCSVD